MWYVMLVLGRHILHGLKPELVEWVANDLCGTIIKLFNLVDEEGFMTLWVINIIQKIFKYYQRSSLRDCRIIMLGTFFGKLIDFDLE